MLRSPSKIEGNTQKFSKPYKTVTNGPGFDAGYYQQIKGISYPAFENKSTDTNMGINGDSVAICEQIFKNQHFKRFCSDQKMMERYMQIHYNGTRLQAEVPYENSVNTTSVGVDPNNEVIVRPIDKHTLKEAQDYLWEIVCTKAIALSCSKILE